MSAGVKNKHGLSRSIPAAVKRQVRKECGFGCVFCGDSLVEHEHISPEFHDARSHDPDRIALLCAGCHSRVTRRIWSKERVLQARLEPHCLSPGFNRGSFDFAGAHPEITIGGSTLRNCRIPVSVSGIPLLKIEGPETFDGPFRLTANFFYSRGIPSLSIVENEWRIRSGVWDAEWSGPRLKIREAQRRIALELVALPPVGILVKRLRSLVRGRYFEATERELRLNGGVFRRVLVDNASVGLSF